MSFYHRTFWVGFRHHHISCNAKQDKKIRMSSSVDIITATEGKLVSEVPDSLD